LATSTSAPSNTYELELPLSKEEVKDAVNEGIPTEATPYEPVKAMLPTSTSTVANAYLPELPLTMNTPFNKEITTKAANAEPVKAILPTFTSTVANAYEPELPLTMNAAKKEITTKAANAGVPVQAEKKSSSYLPTSGNQYQASDKHFNKAQLPKQLPVATAEAPIVPAYSTYQNHGVPVAEKATQYNDYVTPYNTQGTFAQVGQRVPVAEKATQYNDYVTPYTTQGTSAQVGQRATTSIHYPSVATGNVDAYTMPQTETKTSVESNFDEAKHKVAAPYQQQYKNHVKPYKHHATTHYYNGDY